MSHALPHRSFIVFAAVAWAAAFLPEDVVIAQPKPACYALLIAVNEYEDAKLNSPPLRYPQADARALEAKLVQGGYQVTVLEGHEATRANILEALRGLAYKGNSEGAIILGFFGHGVEYSPEEGAMFCPVDTSMRFVRDAENRPHYSERGGRLEKSMEPDPASLISITQILGALHSCRADSKLLLADCCRKASFTARGQAFGSNVQWSHLPGNTSAIFACSTGEEALEHYDWGHGAMTKCFLELLPELAEEDSHACLIKGKLQERVAEIVDDVTGGRKTQTIMSICRGVARLRLKPISVPARVENSLGFELRLTPQSGPERVESSLGIELRRIEDGDFLMGSRERAEDLARAGTWRYGVSENSAERPQHRVRLSRPFYMGTREVTLRQFLTYYHADRHIHRTDAETSGGVGQSVPGVEERRSQFVAWNTGWNTPVTQYMDHPVVNVSWNDAVGFCRWLTERDRGLGKLLPRYEYRLPTEAEWEYACRGGGLAGLFSFGDDPEKLVKYANVGDTTAQNFFGSKWSGTHRGVDGYVYTAPVGSFPANAFGLHDMHGNVSEWCHDAYDATVYSQRFGVAIDPDGGGFGALDRSVRGGAWNKPPFLCRTAYRFSHPADYSCDCLGFRVALVPTY